MDENNMKREAEKIVDKIKELVRDGNVSRVMLKRKGETIVNIPTNAGIIGTVIGLSAAPFTLLVSALVAFGFDCEIEILRKDGTILNLSETEIGSKLEELKDETKEKAREFIKSGDGVEVTVDIDFSGDDDDDDDDVPDIDEDDDFDIDDDE